MSPQSKGLSILALFCCLFHPAGWAQPLSFSGDTPSYHGYMTTLAALWQEKGRGTISMEAAPTSLAIQRAATGEVTFGGTARATRANDRMERQITMFPIAWDALTVIVHPSNPVTGIRLQQLADLYRGRVVSWQELGGEDMPVTVFSHASPRHGLDVTLANLILRDAEANLGADRQFDTTDDIIKAVEQTRNSLAVVNYSRARRARVRLLQVEGQSPNPGSIQSGDYLLYFPLYLGVRTGSQNRRDIREFLRFASSSEARRVMRRNGVVPYPDGMALNSRQLERAGQLDGIRVDG